MKVTGSSPVGSTIILLMKTNIIVISLFFFLIGVVLGGGFIAYITTQAFHKTTDGDSYYYVDKLSQALKNYKSAQNSWPLLYYDKKLNQRIRFIEDVLVKIEKAPALRAFFKSNVSTNEIQSFVQELQKMTGIEEVKYVSKEDAYKIYAQLNKDNQELVKMVSPDILPASLDIYLNDRLIIDKLSLFIKGKNIVEEVVKTSSY